MAYVGFDLSQISQMNAEVLKMGDNLFFADSSAEAKRRRTCPSKPCLTAGRFSEEGSSPWLEADFRRISSAKSAYVRSMYLREYMLNLWLMPICDISEFCEK